MSGVRESVLLGSIPVIVGLIYLALPLLFPEPAQVDAAGGLMLIALGLAMGFSVFVILRGARDI